MSRDIGPQDTLATGNGGNTVTDGGCLPPHNQPQPTDGGDWTPFDRISEVASWICLAAFVVSVVLLCMSLAIFFFL